ncbi:MAG: endonuclease III [Oscillospiraceae bacterium]|nr:endonuclease III [Oscillospiraceae bacterium]
MKKKVSRMLEILDELYPEPECALIHETPLQMLIATQLSAQCTDNCVNNVTPALFERYPTVYDFAEADREELERYIRPTGFYRNKAKNIIACCRRLIDEYGGEVPDNMEDLLTLAGTGRKTANLILGDVFGKSAVVVDTHAGRLSRRIGLTSQTDPTKVEFELKAIVPEESQLKMCHQFISHGRAVCSARKPKCGECRLAEICDSADV